MSQITVSTVEYPSWWWELAGGSGQTWDGARSAVAMLPQGIEFGSAVLVPWSHCVSIEKLT